MSADPTEDMKLRDLRELIAREQVVVIVGAGVSLAATGGAEVAGWRGLLRSGIERCKSFGGVDEDWCERQRLLVSRGDADEWIHVAQLVTKKLRGPRGGEFTGWLRETIGSLKATDTSLLHAVTALGCPIATTNYDHLLESVTGLRAVSWDEPGEVERVIHGAEPGILHLHGHWRRPESIVFGVESYLRVRDDPHADAVRKALRTRSSLLFIGCGDTTSDPNMGAFLEWSGRVFAGSEYRSYRLEADGKVREIQAQHPPEQRIFVVGYGASHEEPTAGTPSCAADNPSCSSGSALQRGSNAPCAHSSTRRWRTSVGDS